MSVHDNPLPKPRPVYLNLVAIRLPIPGIVSFLHRVSGAVLFLFAIPLVLLAVQASLASPESFATLKATFAHPLAKLVTPKRCTKIVSGPIVRIMSRSD